MKKRFTIPIVILLVLITARIYLPYWILGHVNRILNNIPDHYGNVEDVDVNLWKGAYQIHDLYLYQSGSDIEQPFIQIPLTEIAIEWDALLSKQIVGEVFFIEPIVTFATTAEDSITQSGKNVDWTKPIKQLVPLQINKMTVFKGKVNFLDFSTDPQVDLYISDIDMTATNLSNATSLDQELPSIIEGTAISIGEGSLKLNGAMNVLKPIPDLDLNLSFDSVDITALNDFNRAYLGVDAESGVFNLYSELVVKSGNVNGYVKPVIQNFKILDWQVDSNKPLRMLWEGVVSLVEELFKNKKEDQLATKVPLEGTVDQVGAAFFPAIFNLFKNGFISAFQLTTDDTISFEEIEAQNDGQTKE